MVSIHSLRSARHDAQKARNALLSSLEGEVISSALESLKRKGVDVTITRDPQVYARAAQDNRVVLFMDPEQIVDVERLLPHAEPSVRERYAAVTKALTPQEARLYGNS